MLYYVISLFLYVSSTNSSIYSFINVNNIKQIDERRYEEEEEER